MAYVIWGGIASALAVGVVIGIGKMWRDAGRWYADQDRDKQPWERPQP